MEETSQLLKTQAAKNAEPVTKETIITTNIRLPYCSSLLKDLKLEANKKSMPLKLKVPEEETKGDLCLVSFRVSQTLPIVG